MTDADALSCSYAEGARAGRQELLRDLEALRDAYNKLDDDVRNLGIEGPAWNRASSVAAQLAAIIAKHTKGGA